MRKTLSLCILALCAMTAISTFASDIDMLKIGHIESGNNPSAYNDRSHATGIFQVTPICLLEYNNFTRSDYSLDDMFDKDLCYQVAYWYLNERIPQMLRYYNKPVTIENILISYNAGINYVVKSLPLPRETKMYLNKYRSMNE